MSSRVWDTERAPRVVAESGSRSPLAVVAAVVAATALLGLAAWLRGVALPPPVLLPAGAAAEVERAVQAEFGMREPIVWLLEPRAGDVWARPALERLAAMTREVLTLPGVIATDVIGLASPNMRALRITDGMNPEYLMAEVPPDDAGIRALRARVDGDPGYRGNLVTLDGRAAMVVADFSPDGDHARIAQAAIALGERYRDADFDVWVVGAPIVAATAPAAAASLATPLALGAIAGVGTLLAAFGARAGLAALLAALLAPAWTALALIALAAMSIPWSIGAVFPVAVLAAALALCGTGVGAAAAGGGLAAGGIAFALAVGAPAASFGIAAAVGGIFAVATARAMSAAAPRAGALAEAARGRRGTILAAALVAVGVLAAASGIGELSTSFGLAGYGERYLPPPASDGLRALRRLAPPPSSFAVRLRGEAGFVARPDVLHALDDTAAALRRDPAVRDVQSLADIVRRVHRAFNDDDPAADTIPDDRGLNARYLTLAYSPLFRRFVDRSLSRTTQWVLVEGDDAAALARVRGALAAGLAAHPLPGVAIDPIVGDAEQTLETAAYARAIGRAAALLVLALAVAAGIAARVRGAASVLVAAVAASAAGAGLLGWLGLPVDLLGIAMLALTATTAALIAALRSAGAAADRLLALGIALVAAALPLLAWPSAATQVLALPCLGPLCGAALSLPPRAPARAPAP